MLKILVIAVVFAVPIFSHGPNHKHTKKSVIEGTYSKYGTKFSDKCRSVSGAVGIDVDFESLYDEYNDCATGVGDYDQFFDAAMGVLTNIWMVRSGATVYLSDKQKTETIGFLQMYCPKVISYVKCDDVVSPIYEKCLTLAERNEATVGKASWLQTFENFCGNIDQWVDIVNTKGFECGISRGYSCYRDYGISYDPFSNPTLKDFCRFHNMTMNCMGPAFAECGLAQTPDPLMKSLFTNIESETLCGNRGDRENVSRLDCKPLQ